MTNSQSTEDGQSETLSYPPKVIGTKALTVNSFLRRYTHALSSGAQHGVRLQDYAASEPRMSNPTSSDIRHRANIIKPYVCKNLIAVIEDPTDIRNIGTVIRNVNALGVEKTYIVDPRQALPENWLEMRARKSLSKTSVSAIKWSFVKRFDSTEECLEHLEENRFLSIVTSPHVKGRKNSILHEVDYTTYTKLAIWFGNESRGISETAMNASEMCINIPMFGMIESLNLGTTSGIVLYEVTKQRRDYQNTYKRSRKRRPKRAAKGISDDV